MPEKVQSEGKKREDLSFGQIAIREQFVSPDRVLECLEIQRKLQGLDVEAKRIGEILIEKGYLTQEQAGRISDIQTKQRPSSGTRPTRSKKPLTIPGYEILEVVGRGANGVVYRARQVSMDRMVAIKVLAKKQGTDKGFVERFIREAQVVAKLNHENIILGIDVGESQGLHYFVMEFVDGQPVSSILKKEGRLDEKRTIQIAIPILKALAHAREHELVHRDVKPENIMIAQNGVAKLCDLGLAKQTQEGGSDLTREGISVGTPNYISPEQARGENEIDIRSDIYSLGASLYHMATGSTVFTGPNPMVIMTKHVTDKPDPPIKRYEGVSAGLNAVIVKMMQKRREDRYQTPESVMKDLEAILLGNTPSVLVGKGKVTRRVQGGSDISPAIRTRRRVPKKSVSPAIPIFIGIGVVALLAFIFFPKGGGQEKDPVQKSNTTQKNKAPKKTPLPMEASKKKFEEDSKTFREWWGGMISRKDSGWIQAIYARGEKYIEQYEMKATEQKMIDLVKESRGDVNEIILSRIWNDRKQQADEAIKREAYAEAIQAVESIEDKYLSFKTNPNGTKFLTRAGGLQQEFLETLREETIPQAYVMDRKSIETTSGIETYVLISEMVVRYGAEKRADLLHIRKTRLVRDMGGYLSDPFTEKKLAAAKAFLATLSKRWPGDVDLQNNIRREEDSLKKAREDWIRDSGALAATLYQNTFLPPFEAALGRRDLLGARAQLHEVYFGKTYGVAAPSIFVGQIETTLLDAILNPSRVSALDYSSAVKAVEKVAREAKGIQKNSAADFYFALRTYLLLEQCIDSAFLGVPLQSKDSRKFYRYSTAIRKIQNATPISRKAGSPWKITVTQKASGGGTLQKELFLAPNLSPVLDVEDLVLLAKRARLKTWKTDPYFSLQIGILYLYAGEGAKAREWFEKVSGVDAGFELNRFLDRVKNVPDGNLEETAKTKFKLASKLIARETKKALLLCHELEALYSKTEWMTTVVDEKGRKMQKSRLDVVLFWIRELEGTPVKESKKEQGIFQGEVRFQGDKVEADYDFSKPGMDVDFTPSWYQERLRSEQKENGIRLWGRGMWYWKAPLHGDVIIEMDIIANSDQGIGAAVHGEGFERGYVAIADMEGDGAWRPLEGQSILYKQPVSARNWNEQYLGGGSKSVRFQKGRSYKIRLER
ncbi:MAG: serine/threonine-protein kinase, partial [Planctomycetota bacterium]|nr:serine/threonine-protein kinase [Planctomycetota bacterium]